MAGKGADTIRDAALQRGMPQRDWKDLLRTPGCAGGDCRAPGQLLPGVRGVHDVGFRARGVKSRCQVSELYNIEDLLPGVRL